MLHFIGEFKEDAVAEACKKYIPLYLKKPGDEVVYIPYYDDNLRKKRYVKFVLLAGKWVYVDNSQNS